jgi:hypothetical protein
VADNSANVRVAVTGEVYVGATTATPPSDADTAPGAGFKGLGFVSEDGVTETRDRSTTDIKAWQNAATVRTVITDATLTYQFTMIETNPDTVALFYGAAITGSADDGTFDIVPASTGGRKSFVIDVIDGDELIRTYVAQGEVTEVGDRVYASGEPVGYDVTITAYPDSTGKAAQVWATALADAA